jgi:hypothetical protein
MDPSDLETPDRIIFSPKGVTQAFRANSNLITAIPSRGAMPNTQKAKTFKKDEHAVGVIEALPTLLNRAQNAVWEISQLRDLETTALRTA